MLRKVRLFSRCHPYRSHRRAFEQLMVLLRPYISETPGPEQAEAMLFYGSPYHVNEWAPSIPNFDSLYRIGHFVWETDCLSSDQQRGLMRVDEVWTPSYYCWRIFRKYHPRVFFMPHVVVPPATLAPQQDLDRIKQSIGDGPGIFLFVSIGTDDLRKNYPVLIEAFTKVHAEYPNTRLLIKHEPQPGKQGTVIDGAITRIYEYVSQGFIEAMYARADTYVSAHHSEGWGYTMSDSMARRVLAVAPAYGGNMEFMTPQNSILVPTTEGPIGANPEQHWFHPDMRWGHVSIDDLAAGMKGAYRLVTERRVDHILSQAYSDAMHFDTTFGSTVAHTLMQNVLETLSTRPKR